MRFSNNDCKYYDSELDCCKYFSDWTDAMPILQPCIDSPYAMCHRAEKKVATDTNVGDKSSWLFASLDEIIDCYSKPPEREV